MKVLSKLALIIVVVIAVLVGALAIFAATFDANDYKQQIISLVKKQTGRELDINGDLKLAIYPDIALEVGKASLSNATGFSDKQFATISSGKVSVKLLPLLKKKIDADEIYLDGLQLNLQRKANGSTNWDDLEQSNNSTDKKEEQAPAKTIQEFMDNLSIAGVNLKDAKIHWLDEQAKQDITLAPFNLKTGKFSVAKPLPIELAVVVKQKSPAATIALEGNTTLTLSKDNQNFSLSKLKLHSNITTAQLGKGNLEANISGDIKGNSQKINITGLNLETNLTGELIPEGAIKTKLNGNVDFDVNAQLLTIMGMKVDSNVNGKPLAGGTLQAQVSGDTKFDIAKQLLTTPNLVVDTKMSGGYIKGGAANTKITAQTQFDLKQKILVLNGMQLVANANGDILQGGNATSNIKADILVNLAQSQIKSPSITIDSQVEGGLIPGGKLSQTAKGNIDLNWVSKKGVVNLSNLLVMLAGMEIKGSQVKFQPLANKPTISGQFQSNTFNLKQVMKTLGIDTPATSNPKALSQLQATFSLTADADKAEVQGLTLKLDNSTLTGKLGITNFTSPSIRPQLTIDTINLDDYLAPASQSTTTSQTKSSSSQELLPLETLRKVNIDGDVKIGKMVVNKLKLSNLYAKINAKQGLINIDPANASLYSGKYKGRISIDAKQATPTMKMRHELVGLRSEGLLFDLFQDKYISGGTKLVTELSSRGNSIDALLKNLNGNTSIAFNDGTIRDSNLAEKVSLAVKVFEKKELKDGKSVVRFTGLSGDWKTNNGVFKTDNLSMLSPFFNISGSGTADVASQKLDMKLRIGPNTKAGEKPLFAPLTITGTFSNPKFGLDLKNLIKSLAAQDIEKVKREAKQKLDAKKQELELKLAKEKAVQKQKLQQKLDNAKANALKKLKAKTGGDLGNKLLDKIGGGSKADPTSETQDPNAPPPEKKSSEEQIKDKLKNKLKGLF